MCSSLGNFPRECVNKSLHIAKGGIGCKLTALGRTTIVAGNGIDKRERTDNSYD